MSRRFLESFGTVRSLLLLLLTMTVAGILLVLAPVTPHATADEDLLGTSTWNPLNRSAAGHFRVADPANVDPEEAERAYQLLRREMTARYALSGLDAAADYATWARYNTSPYRSVTHGRRYLNNYANALGSAYGRYEAAGPMPEGAVLAKDSFSIDTSGEILPGPLFLMIKMEPGFNPPSNDWRYVTVLPDGSVLGSTKGENADNVAFCVPCHAAASRSQDHLFFPRRRFRRLDQARTD